MVGGRLEHDAARRAVVLAVTAVGALLAACAPPAAPGGGPARGPTLYVADERGGTLTRLDAAVGRRLGTPLPVGPAPAQLVVAPDGAALVLSGGDAAPPGRPGGPGSRGAGAGPGLTWVPRAGAGWAARPVALGPGARAVLLAGDNGDRAAVAYTLPGRSTGDAEGLPPEAPCGLALVDLRTGAVEAAYPVCAPRELPTGLALEDTADGPVAYLALWHRATPAGPGFRPAGARLRRLAARTGAPLGEAPADGLPRPPAAGGSLLLAPGPGGGARAPLYLVAAVPGSRLATWDATEYAWQFPLSGGWRLQRLAPDTLDPEADVGLAFAPAGLAVAPDGARAYAFDALSDDLVQIDLSTGRLGLLARLPGSRPWGLAVTADRLYAANPPGGEVWVFDRAAARRVAALRTGGAPVGIGLAP
jgi:hypothetical protein